MTRIKKYGESILKKRGLNHLETRKEVFSLEPIMGIEN